VRATVRFCGILPAMLGLHRSEMVVEVEPGSTLGDVVTAANIPDGVVMAFVVNGKMRALDHEVRDGDDIAAIHPLSGG
jgi:sulfur carrier protein ThiS